MDNFIVSARKYRPKKFEDVIGQQSIANTLKKAIQNNKLASAYLFCGPRGVGKTTCARIFAKAINCLNPQPDGEACDECESCRNFNEQRSVNIQELNAAANNSVEAIRAIIDQVYIPPQLGKYKVIILDEVHMLSQSASNALLKTLEEPPSYVIFILATTEKNKILQTIQSRCQIFDFNRMDIDDIINNLKTIASKENITYEDTALNVIAQKADGGMRDALSIFDQVSNYAQGNITYDSVLKCINALDYDYYFKMIDLLLKHDVVNSMLLLNDIISKGFNEGVFIAGLASHCRDLLMSRDQSTLPLLNVAQSVKQHYSEQANKCSVKFLYYAIRLFDRCSNSYKDSYNKRLSVEITLIEAAQYSDDDSIGSGLRPTKLKPLFKTTDTLPQAARSVNKPQAQSQVPPHTQPQPATALNGAMAVTSNGQKLNVATNATSAKAQSATQATNIASFGSKNPDGILGRRRMGLKEALEQARSTRINGVAGENTVNSGPTATGSPATEGIAPKVEDFVPKNVVSSTLPITNNDDEDTDNDIEDEVDGTSFEDIPSNVIFYSQEQVDAQWKKCSDAIKPNSMSMSQRMLAMPKECRPDHTIIVSLHNEYIQKDFAKFIPFVENFLNNAFHLNDIKIETKILPVELVQIITSPTKLLDKMRKDNPNFAKFMDNLDLHLV